jgi:uncharacterized membrane protein
MPNIGIFHPQIVHFVVALLFVGMIARVITLLPLGALSQRLAFGNPMATTLILVGTVAAVAAVQSGHDAHDPVERIPGVAQAVRDHEDLGEDTRNIFLVVAALELAALALATRRATWSRIARYAGTAVGIAGLVILFEAAEHGGDLVYAYGGGPGLRSGDTTDVRRLLISGLYNEAQAARKAGRKEEAARLVTELVTQMPGDPSATLIAAQSQLQDKNDARGALATLATVQAPDSNFRLVMGKGFTMAQAYEALGRKDSARIVLETLKGKFPQSRRIQQELDRLSK